MDEVPPSALLVHAIVPDLPVNIGWIAAAVAVLALVLVVVLLVTTLLPSSL